MTINAVDPARSFIVCDFAPGSSRASSTPTCELTGPTTVVITTGEPLGTVVNWQVVQFLTGVTVQRGLTSFGTTDALINVAISSVNTSRSFAIVTRRSNSTLLTEDEKFLVRARLVNPTRLELSRAVTGTGSLDVAWQVIEMTNATVQGGLTTIGAGSLTANAAISSVDTTRSFLVFSTQGSAGIVGVEGRYYVRGRIANATTLTFARMSSLNSVDIAWFVVSMTNGTTVQAGTALADTATSQIDVPITSVDTSRTISLISSTGGNDNNEADLDEVAWNSALTSQTNLRLLRSPPARASDVDWFVVQFLP